MKFNDWLKHPFVLMVMGFGLTTIIGNAYVNKMNLKEFKTKQKILYQEKLLVKQIALSEDLILSLKDYLSVTNKIYEIYFSGNHDITVSDLKNELRENDWNKKKDVIGYKTMLYFENDSIPFYLTKIENILYKGPDSNNFLFIKLFSKTPSEFKNDKDERNKIFKKITKNRLKIQANLNKVLVAMRIEIKNFDKGK